MTNEQLAVFIISIKNQLQQIDPAPAELKEIIDSLQTMNHILQGK